MNKTDWLIVAILIVLGLLFRFLNTTPERLHFRGDQATSSLRAKEIYEKREVTLIGIPITSFSYDGHEARVSSTAYYLQLIPLILGDFDPYNSNRAMAVLGTLMILPLYWGTKMLSRNNRWAAAMMATSWSLLPNYIQFTSFLWNPNSQLLLLPITILMMGLFEKKQKNLYLGLVGCTLGLALTLHYQFGLAIVGILAVYAFLLWKRSMLPSIIWLVGGLGVGFSPVIVSEILTEFYNVRIFSLILSHLSEVKIASGAVGVPLHYLNSTFLMLWLGIILLLTKSKVASKISPVLVVVFLGLLNIFLFISPSSKNFSLIEPPRENWDFTTEEKINEMIRAKDPENFNIYNVAYLNPFAEIQKYLLAVRDKELSEKINPSYYENKQLFIMARKEEDLSRAINYEIYTFSPSKTEVYPVNETYVLHYWERE